MSCLTPDRFGREPLGDAKARVAREYVRVLTDRCVSDSRRARYGTW